MATGGEGITTEMAKATICNNQTKESLEEGSRGKVHGCWLESKTMFGKMDWETKSAMDGFNKFGPGDCIS